MKAHTNINAEVKVVRDTMRRVDNRFKRHGISCILGRPIYIKGRREWAIKDRVLHT